MQIHLITIFPEILNNYFNSSIMKIAQNKWKFNPVLYNLCDYTVKNTRRVDSRPYWGLPWTILAPIPLWNCIESIWVKTWKKIDIFHLSPTWKKIKQKTFENFAKKQKDCIIICSHYEWIDARIIDYYKVKEFSIWDYVITSWELAAMVFIDWIIRLLPWVLNEKSLKEESFSFWLWWKKEYPQYTRPENYKWLKVPEDLLSWNPKKIEKWKESNIKL